MLVLKCDAFMYRTEACEAAFMYKMNSACRTVHFTAEKGRARGEEVKRCRGVMPCDGRQSAEA